MCCTISCCLALDSCERGGGTGGEEAAGDERDLILPWRLVGESGAPGADSLRGRLGIESADICIGTFFSNAGRGDLGPPVLSLEEVRVERGDSGSPGGTNSIVPGESNRGGIPLGVAACNGAVSLDRGERSTGGTDEIP